MPAQTGSTLPAFAAGMGILTTRGVVAVDDLVAGDMVLTRDSGYAPLRFAAKLEGLHPMVAVGPDTLGPGAPQHDLIVAAGLGLWELHNEANRRPVEALRLCAMPGAHRASPRRMVALLCDRAVGLFSGGAWVECPAPTARLVAQMLPLLAEPDREALVAAFADQGLPAAAAQIAQATTAPHGYGARLH